jgi:hypothetical protein
MFRHLPVYAHAPETLIALGQTMIHREERENGMLDKPVEVADKEDETGARSATPTTAHSGFRPATPTSASSSITTSPSTLPRA